MPSVPSTFQEILRSLVLRLILMVESALSRRIAGLRRRVAAVGEGDRHHLRLSRELAKAERYEAILADPGFWDDLRIVGKATEIARVVRDAGRRALVRCYMWPARVRRMRAFALVGDVQGFGRCTRGGLRGLVRGCSPHPTLSRGRGLSVCVEPSGGGGLPAGLEYVRAAGRVGARRCPSPNPFPGGEGF